MGQQELTTDGYIFLDISRPYVAWAAYRSVLITPPNIQDSNGRFVSWWQAELHRNSTHIKREMALEKIRVQQFPGRVSRLNGIFCFLDKDSATDAADHWGSHFKIENLAEVNLLEAQGRDRLDSNWITYADSNTVLPSDAWITRYWRGEPYPGKKPIWETLVDCNVLEEGMQVDSNWRIYNFRITGKVEYDDFYMKESKPIIDEIDHVLAEHYGFTDEELDFIINYDIKYRMGREALKT